MIPALAAGQRKRHAISQNETEDHATPAYAAKRVEAGGRLDYVESEELPHERDLRSSSLVSTVSAMAAVVSGVSLLPNLSSAAPTKRMRACRSWMRMQTIKTACVSHPESRRKVGGK